MTSFEPQIELDLPLLIDAAFCAGSAMIAFGAVLGKATPSQITWLLVLLVREIASSILKLFSALSQLSCVAG